MSVATEVSPALDEQVVDNPRRAHLFKGIWVRLATTAVLLLVVGLLVLRWIHSETPAPVKVEGSPLPAGSFRPTKEQYEGLTIVPVQAMSFQGEQTTDGTIAANDDTTTSVYSPFSGRVQALYAKLGDSVTKGTPLMLVEASEFVQGQGDLVAGLAALNSAQAQVRLTEAAEQRQHELYVAKAGALKDWLQAQSDVTSAQGALRTAQIALDAARNRLAILGKTESEISALETAPSTHPMSPQATVRSPISGTVIQRQIGLGQYIQSAAAGASSPVYVIGNLSTVWLIANVRETDVAQLQVGQAVAVRVPAWPNRVFKARISWVAAALDPSTHRLLVRADVDNRDGALKPMMFAKFQITTGTPVTAPSVPQEAIVYEGSDAHVFVVRDDRAISLRAIKVGRTEQNNVEVTDGLTVGEKVVSHGSLFIDRASESK